MVAHAREFDELHRAHFRWLTPKHTGERHS